MHTSELNKPDLWSATWIADNVKRKLSVHQFQIMIIISEYIRWSFTRSTPNKPETVVSTFSNYKQKIQILNCRYCHWLLSGCTRAPRVKQFSELPSINYHSWLFLYNGTGNLAFFETAFVSWGFSWTEVQYTRLSDLFEERVLLQTCLDISTLNCRCISAMPCNQVRLTRINVVFLVIMFSTFSRSVFLSLSTWEELLKER